MSPFEKQNVFGSMEAMFKDQKLFKEYLRKHYGSPENIPSEFIRVILFEREKLPEELEIINFANEKTNGLRKNFNLPDFDIPPENIYIIPHDAPWPGKLENDSGYFTPQGQFIAFREANAEQIRRSKLYLANKILHEMIHFKYYDALRKIDKMPVDREACFGFGNLGEAVAEELCIILLNESRENPLFSDEFEKTDNIKKYLSGKKTSGGESLVNGDEYYLDIDKEKSILWKAKVERSRERRALHKLIDRIIQKSKGQFKSKNEVFSLFVKMVVTGETINLERLIDKTFGEGTFRKIVELDDDVKQQEEFVNNL